ncbi:MAG: glucose-6-phosphate dehydrogenase, partial [Acidobacteriia bacterium]|nr:glucose-6-phosphate dehydrogenase [Terriglobia bacterium]
MKGTALGAARQDMVAGTITTDANLLKNPLREGLQAHRSPEPCAMVVFGASGDLTERKIVPALYYLSRERLLPPGFSIIGCARTRFTHDQFREKMRDAVTEFLALPREESESFIQGFGQGIFYIADNFSDPAAYGQLKGLLERLDHERGTSGNRLFYLATRPSFFPVIIQHLGA